MKWLPLKLNIHISFQEMVASILHVLRAGQFFCQLLIYILEYNAANKSQYININLIVNQYKYRIDSDCLLQIDPFSLSFNVVVCIVWDGCAK